MSKIVHIKILSGIPGCGKSTWSRKYIFQHPDVKRINRDDLRKMCDDSRFTEGNENFVNQAKLSLIRTGIELEKDMILDDTHCYNDYLIYLIAEIRKFAIELDKSVVIEFVDFLINTNVCVKRNSERKNKIEESFIYHMINMRKEIIIDNLDIDLYTTVE
jgi:tRNA uridine 5-carbamoylmethylation protein Kti12